MKKVRRQITGAKTPADVGAENVPSVPGFLVAYSYCTITVTTVVNVTTLEPAFVLVSTSNE